MRLRARGLLLWDSNDVWLWALVCLCGVHEALLGRRLLHAVAAARDTQERAAGCL